MLPGAKKSAVEADPASTSVNSFTDQAKDTENLNDIPIYADIEGTSRCSGEILWHFLIEIHSLQRQCMRPSFSFIETAGQDGERMNQQHYEPIYVNDNFTKWYQAIHQHHIIS